MAVVSEFSITNGALYPVIEQSSLIEKPTCSDRSLTLDFDCRQMELRNSFSEGMRTFFSSGLPKMSSRKSNSSTEKTRRLQTNSVTPTLNELDVFLTPDEIHMMAEVADNAAYSEPFFVLKSGHFNFSLTQNQTPEICKVLYWGFKNGELTATEFIERYNQALIFLCFFPSQMPSPLDQLPDLATNIEVVTPESLPLRDIRKQELGVLYQQNNIKKETDYFLKVTLSDKMRQALILNKGVQKDNKFTRDDIHSATPQIQNYGFWFRLLDRTFKYFIMDRKNYFVLYIPSFTLMHAMAINRIGTSSTFAKPNFGAGSWEQLAEMRLQKEQPMSLFFPQVSSCIFRPDGYWLGTMSHYHDLFHTSRVNEIPFTIQQQLILLDRTCEIPLLSFLGKLDCTDGAECSIDGNDLKFILHYKRLVNIWIKQKLIKEKSLLRLNRFLNCLKKPQSAEGQAFHEYLVQYSRPLIDQEISSAHTLQLFKDDELLPSTNKVDVTHLMFSQYLLLQLTCSENVDGLLELLQLTVVKNQPCSELFPVDILSSDGTVDKKASQQGQFQWCFSYWERVFKQDTGI